MKRGLDIAWNSIILVRRFLEKQIESETEWGEKDEECELIIDDCSDLDSITGIVKYYLEEGDTEESIC